MTSERATDPGYGSGGQRTYRRDPKGTSTGGQFTSNPAAAQRTPTGAYAAALAMLGRGSGNAAKAPTAPSASTRKFKTLAPGEDNDPQAVNELQRLLGALGIPIGFSGVYDDATVEAIKQVQRKLGMKNPNGRASRSLVNQMLAAYDLSPCLNPGS